MGRRLKPINQGLYILYYVEEWEYKKKVVYPSSRPAKLKDVVEYGKLSDILGILSYLAILPIKFSSKLSKDQIENFVGSILQLLLFSSAIAIISKGKGLDPNRELTKCYRKAFDKTITEFGIKDERARGISSEKVGSEDYLNELLSRIKVRQITRISKLDEKFRVTLPRYSSRSLDWQVGDELLVIPHESKKWGKGFFLYNIDVKKHAQKTMVEAEVDMIRSFTLNIIKEVDCQGLEKCIEENVDVVKHLPQELQKYAKKLFR